MELFRRAASEEEAFSPEPGVFHFMTMESESPTRFHLRVDEDRAGILMANAAEAAHLSPVGVVMAYGVLDGWDDGRIRSTVKASFRGSSDERIDEDLQRVHELIEDLASPDDNYPVTNFAGVDADSHARRLSAPYRADIVHADADRVTEMLQRLWDVGVPHITLLARDDAEDADEADLVRILEAAEDIGMIAGVRGPGSWFSDELFEQMVLAGLDYIVHPIASREPERHDELLGLPGDHEATLAAFGRVHQAELCAVAQVPLIEETGFEVEQIVGLLADRSVYNVWFFAIACLDDEEEAVRAGALPARALPQMATLVTELAERYNSRFIWQPPVRFDGDKSITEQIIDGPRASGDVSIRIEADGSVFPARGPRTCVGNILTDEWEQIWGQECFRRHREKVERPAPIRADVDLPIADAYAPDDPAGWSDDTQDGDE